MVYGEEKHSRIRGCPYRYKSVDKTSYGCLHTVQVKHVAGMGKLGFFGTRFFKVFFNLKFINIEILGILGFLGFLGGKFKILCYPDSPKILVSLYYCTCTSRHKYPMQCKSNTIDKNITLYSLESLNKNQRKPNRYDICMLIHNIRFLVFKIGFLKII